MADRIPIHRSGEVQVDDDGVTRMYAVALQDFKKGETGAIGVKLQKRGDVKTEGKAEEDVENGTYSWFVHDHEEDGLEDGISEEPGQSEVS